MSFIYNLCMTKRSNLISNYFKPSIYIRSFKSIDIGQLKLQGIKLFICDLDNTLVPHYVKFPTRDVSTFVRKIKDAGIEFILTSSSDKNRTSIFGDKLNVEWHAGLRKPFTRVLNKIIKRHGVKNNEVIYMGDQMLVDIFLANRLKIDSILVNPIVSTNEKFNPFQEFMEKQIYKRLERKNILVKGSYTNTSTDISYDIL